MLSQAKVTYPENRIFLYSRAKVDRYFERGIEEYRYGKLPTLHGFHRPLSDYLKALIRSGFILTDFEEPVSKEKDAEEHQRQLNDDNRIAWFLVIGAMKT